jgi:hypothetical protein
MKEKESKEWYKLSNVEYLTNMIEKESSTIIGVFLQEMNKTARDIGMLSTNIANPHGLSNFFSLSTANDLAKLCSAAMKNPIFREIVKTQNYNY